jgi:outer membrane biosynthesis protein TonB
VVEARVWPVLRKAAMAVRVRAHTPDQERDKMRFTMATLTAAMLLSYGSMAPAYAQRDGQGDKQDENRGESGRTQRGRQQDRGGGTPRAPQVEQQRPAQPRERQPQQIQREPQIAPQAQQRQQQQQQERQPQQAQQRSQPQQQQSAQRRDAQSDQTQHARGQQPPQRSQQQARTWQQQRGWAQNGASQGHATFQQNRAQHWAADHRSWAQRGGYGGYYVPQDRFSISFGRQHFFRLNTRPVMYQGYPRFEYGGYSFLMVDPWPEYWPDNWYSSDDVYIDYDDGYYLYDRRDPQVRLAITITM